MQAVQRPLRRFVRNPAAASGVILLKAIDDGALRLDVDPESFAGAHEALGILEFTKGR